MHHAPAVYVPTQPEGNGLTMPTLLSLLAHGLVIGMLVYSYQNSEVEMAGSIETVMVSPEQLADMQGQILANRAAAQAASASTVTQANESDSNDTNQNSTQPSSQQVPSFSRPDDTTGRPLLMSEEHHQRLLEQNREYEQRIAKWAAELDESVLEEHDTIEQDKRDERIEEQKRLGDFRNKQKNPPHIIKPSTPTDRNLISEPSSSDSAPQDYSLAGDGKPTISGSTSSQSGPSGGSSKSKKQYINGIVSQIKNSFAFPENTYGQTVELIIKVNQSGRVTSVTTSLKSGGSDVAKAAAIAAAKQASPLDIDADNFEDYKEIEVTVTIPSAS